MLTPRIVRKAHDVRAALRGKPMITSESTLAEFRAACPTLASFDKGAVTLGRFAAPTPWENHPEGDEFRYVVDGRLGIILLTGRRRVRVAAHSDSIFVVHRGVWQRQVPRPVAAVLSALPTAHGPISWAEDPRHTSARRRPAARSRKRIGAKPL